MPTPSVIVIRAPPPAGTFTNALSTKKPIQLESREKNGPEAPSVPRSNSVEGESSLRLSSFRPPSSVV